MAEDLADLAQRGTSSKHRRGGAVTQAMRRGPDSGTFAGASHDHAHPVVRQSDQRRVHPQEHRPGCHLGTAVVYIRHERFADIDGEGKPVPTTALATDDDLAVAPVDIVKDHGALLVVPMHRTDRRVDVDGHRLGIDPAPRNRA
jgi:hypothetical protein